MQKQLNQVVLSRRALAGAGVLALLAGCGGGDTEKDEDAVAPTLTISSDTPGDAPSARRSATSPPTAS